MHKILLPLAAWFLLPGVLLAQQTLEQARAAVFREAERYVNCWMRSDVGCVEELTHRELLEQAGISSPELSRVREVAGPTYKSLWAEHYHRIEVAEPWPPFSLDNKLFAFVPYFEALVQQRINMRGTLIGYLIGASDDDGASWRFIQVNINSTLEPDAIDLVVRGYGDRPRPVVGVVDGAAPPLERSRWLETTERQFVVDGDAIAYALKFAVREEVEVPMDLTVRYDNPAEPGEPLQFRGMLDQGQRELQWQSPALRGFELGEKYDVVIAATDPDTGTVLFTHREKLLFFTTRDIWLSLVVPPESPAP